METLLGGGGDGTRPRVAHARLDRTKIGWSNILEGIRLLDSPLLESGMDRIDIEVDGAGELRNEDIQDDGERWTMRCPIGFI